MVSNARAHSNVASSSRRPRDAFEGDGGARDAATMIDARTSMMFEREGTIARRAVTTSGGEASDPRALWMEMKPRGFAREGAGEDDVFDGSCAKNAIDAMDMTRGG